MILQHPETGKVDLDTIFLELRLGPGVDIDLGANVGDVTDQLLRLGATSVLAVEPLSANVTTITQRFQDDDRVSIFHGAVGSETGRATLFIKPAGPGEVSAGSSLRRDKSNVSQDVVEVVDVQRLSDMLLRTGRVRILKMDIEGSEYDVLKEAIGAGVLADHVSVLLFEDHVRKLPAILKDRERVVSWLLVNMPGRVFVHIDPGYVPLEDIGNLKRYGW